MKHKTHIVKVFVYNPKDLKEVSDKLEFTISYIPTKKWNEYLILVNNVYCKHKLNFANIINRIDGKHQNIRETIAASIRNYLNNDVENYQNRVKVYYPNDQIFKLKEKVFKEKILNLSDFKNRDELTKYNLICNN